ncbi:MAG: hypothetical protein KIT70_03795 [Anaerolineales bacterium]|nr:MAG: hypothetical protein KIT70_03795 [Anaerolineales bacterium]
MAQAAPTSLQFDPPRRRGTGLHVSAALLVLTVAAVLFLLALAQPPGVVGIILLVAGSLICLLLPLLFYRLYCLHKSGYWISRDGLRLRWGLRAVDLPYDAIVDIARWSELEVPPQLPRAIWPGSVLGQVSDAELGTVEYMASDRNRLVLLGTAERVYVLSPEKDAQFVAALKRESLRGSLRPLRARSTAPSFVLVEAWARPLPRRLMTVGGVAALVLLLLVGFVGPGLPGVSLGFGPDNNPLPSVAGTQLLLLPGLNLLFYVGNLLLGLLFFREPQGDSLSVLLWGSSPVTSVLFLAAIIVSIL